MPKKKSILREISHCSEPMVRHFNFNVDHDDARRRNGSSTTIKKAHGDHNNALKVESESASMNLRLVGIVVTPKQGVNLSDGRYAVRFVANHSAFSLNLAGQTLQCYLHRGTRPLGNLDITLSGVRSRQWTSRPRQCRTRHRGPSHDHTELIEDGVLRSHALAALSI